MPVDSLGSFFNELAHNSQYFNQLVNEIWAWGKSCSRSITQIIWNYRVALSWFLWQLKVFYGAKIILLFQLLSMKNYLERLHHHTKYSPRTLGSCVQNKNSSLGSCPWSWILCVQIMWVMTPTVESCGFGKRQGRLKYSRIWQWDDWQPAINHPYESVCYSCDIIFKLNMWQGEKKPTYILSKKKDVFLLFRICHVSRTDVPWDWHLVLIFESPSEWQPLGPGGTHPMRGERRREMSGQSS